MQKMILRMEMLDRLNRLEERVRMLEERFEHMRTPRMVECLYCNYSFEVGPGSGRRADAKFCCLEHQQRYNSLKRTSVHARTAT